MKVGAETAKPLMTPIGGGTSRFFLAAQAEILPMVELCCEHLAANSLELFADGIMTLRRTSNDIS